MRYYTLLLPLLFTLSSMAQMWDGMTYQAVARNANGDPIVNQTISLRLDINYGLSWAGWTCIDPDPEHGDTFSSWSLSALQSGALSIRVPSKSRTR